MQKAYESSAEAEMEKLAAIRASPRLFDLLFQQTKLRKHLDEEL